MSKLRFNVVSKIENCSSEGGKISGNRFIGGIVGYNYWSTIKDCKANINVIGRESVGGIFGKITDLCEIIGSTSKGKVIKMS